MRCVCPGARLLPKYHVHKLHASTSTSKLRTTHRTVPSSPPQPTHARLRASADDDGASSSDGRKATDAYPAVHPTASDAVDAQSRGYEAPEAAHNDSSSPSGDAPVVPDIYGTAVAGPDTDDESAAAAEPEAGVGEDNSLGAQLWAEAQTGNEMQKQQQQWPVPRPPPRQDQQLRQHFCSSTINSSTHSSGMSVPFVTHASF